MKRSVFGKGADTIWIRWERADTIWILRTSLAAKARAQPVPTNS